MLREIYAAMQQFYHGVRNAADWSRVTLEALRREPCYQDPRCLIPFGGKVYSQNDEDGILREIFRRIGTHRKVFVEFGVGHGLENNSVSLLLDDWRGLWLEGNRRFVEQIQRGFRRMIAEDQLRLVHTFITRDNIDDLIRQHTPDREVDLLSVDIDGNDFHVLERIQCISPRVIVMEYNSKFAPPLLYCMDYDDRHMWDGTDKMGASLKFLELALAARGYHLVGCSLTGINAFFVRHDLVGDQFLPPFTAETHYQPPRYWLSGFSAGHRPSYATVDNRLRSARQRAAGQGAGSRP
ncbi:MAG: hypothetical protein KGQ51_06185 [Planctomycetes bacterium]|nr:hypothetical protein [Planctomycetota bacterium]